METLILGANHRKSIEEGGYESDEVKTFWVENDDGEKVGIVKIYDLQDEIPLFDLRIADLSTRIRIRSESAPPRCGICIRDAGTKNPPGRPYEAG